MELHITSEDFKLIKQFYPEFTRKPGIESNEFIIGWSELMPAWIKFRDINPTGFLQALSEHDDWKHIIGSAILYDDIKTACEKLVEGIKWYNTQNSNPTSS